MKLGKIWSIFVICVLAAGLLTACDSQAEQSPEVSEPAVTESAPASEPPSVQTDAEAEPPDEEVPVEEAPAEEPVTEKVLTEAERKDWEEWLNSPGVCQLFWTPFEDPDEVKLHEMFYNGVGDHADDLTEEEYAALEAVAGEIYLDVTRVTVDEIITTFREVLGEELTPLEVEKRLEHWYYLKEYDAYYHIHGDTMTRRVTCTGGVMDPEDGSIVLTCYCDWSEDEVYTVGLKELKDYYVIDYIRLNEN